MLLQLKPRLLCQFLHLSRSLDLIALVRVLGLSLNRLSRLDLHDIGKVCTEIGNAMKRCGESNKRLRETSQCANCREALRSACSCQLVIVSIPKPHWRFNRHREGERETEGEIRKMHGLNRSTVWFLVMRGPGQSRQTLPYFSLCMGTGDGAVQ